MTRAMDVSKYADVDDLETMGEVHSRLFAVYVEAALPQLAELSRRHAIPMAAMLAAFLAMRQAEATEAVAASVEELVEGFRRRDDADGDEPWKKK